MKMNEFYKNKKVFITGNTGFKGSWLTQTLIRFGAQVVGYSIEIPPEPSLFKILKLDTKIKTYFEDIRNYPKLNSAIETEKPDIIFHLAAQPIVRRSYDEPLFTIETNTLGTANLLCSLRNCSSVKSVVMITTDKVYKDQDFVWPYREVDQLGGYDPYSCSKACAELIINSFRNSYFNTKDYGESHNILIASARAGNVVGGGDWSEDRLIPDIARTLVSNKELVIRSPKAIRPWQFVLEPLSGYLVLAKKLFEEDTRCASPWNFAPVDTNFVDVETVVKYAIQYLKKGSYSIKEDSNKHETHILKLDSSKAKDLLGWRPQLSKDETFQWTFEWYERFYKNANNINELTFMQIDSYFKRCDYE